MMRAEFRLVIWSAIGTDCVLNKEEELLLTSGLASTYSASMG